MNYLTIAANNIQRDHKTYLHFVHGPFLYAFEITNMAMERIVSILCDNFAHHFENVSSVCQWLLRRSNQDRDKTGRLTMNGALPPRSHTLSHYGG
jgi:hypothetical protein